MADENKDLETQVNLQQELNNIFAARQSTLASQTQQMGAQANLAKALEGMLSSMADSSKDSSDNSGNLASALQAANDAASGATDSSGNLADALKNAANASQDFEGAQQGAWAKFQDGVKDAENFGDIMSAVSDISLGDMADSLGLSSKSAGALGAALAGISLGDLAESFTSTFAQIGSVISGAFSAVSNIGMGIFGALSGAMGMLADAAHQGGAANVEVANAWESVASSISRSSPAFESVTTAVSNLGMEGASLGAMFGSGPGGMAAAIEYAGEVAAGLGDTLGKVADDFAQNIDSYVIANKALGIEAESLSNMQLMAAHSGQDLSAMLDATAVASVHLSQQFGIDAKRIGSNLNEMTGDYATFGGMSVESLTSTAAYAAKLGIAMKDLQGITAKTDDFEGAAMAASELAGTFGMTVDTMELMNADPAEKAEMIRQSFLETGQSFDEMSRQEKARMADITGMSQEALAGAFDPENAELGLDDFNSAADAAAAGAISQEEANLILAKSIDKVHEALGGGSEELGGPFSAFFSGVVKGITNSEEFIALAQNFYDVMRLMFNEGQKLGKMFVEMFPGVKELLGGLADFFDPDKWQAMMTKVMDHFTQFFKDLATDPQQAVQDLMNNLLGEFEGFMDGNKGAVSMMKEGAIKMIHAIGGIITGMIPWLTEKLVEMIRGLADALSGQGAPADPNTIGGALSIAFSNAFSALKDALKVLIPELLMALGQVLWANKGMVAMALGAMALWMGAQFAFQLGKAILFEYLKAKIMGKLTKAMKDDMPGPDEAPGPSKGVMESMREGIEQIGQISLTDVGKAIVIAAMLVVFIGVSMVGMAYAIAKAATILGPIPFEDVAKALIAMAVAVGGVWVMAKIAKTLKPGVLLQGGLGLVLGAVFLGIAGGLFAYALKTVNDVLGGLDILRVIEVLAMIGLSALAVWGAALGGMAMIADGGITLGLGALGMVAGAAFLYVAGGLFALALREVYKVFDGIDLLRVIGILGTMGLTFIAIAGLGVGGALLALAIPVLLAAVPGLEAGAMLLEVAAGTFAKTLTKIVQIFTKIPGGIAKVEQALGILHDSMGMIAGMAVLGAAFRLFRPLVGMLTEGLVAAGDFAATGFEQVGRVLRAIERIPIADPERTKAVVDITGTIVSAMADIAGLGIQMAAVSAVGALFGDTDMDEMINMSVRFIEAVGDTLGRLIVLLVASAGDMSPEAIEGAGAIGGMLGAVSELTTAMQGPINAITENHGAMDTLLEFVGGAGADEKIASVVEGMTDLLNAVGPAIPGLVDAMSAGLARMPAGMGEKAKAFGDMLSGISAVLGMWDDYDNKISASESERGMGMEGTYAFRDTSFARDIRQISELISWEGWADAAQAVSTAGSFNIDAGAGDTFNASFDAFATISEGVTDSLNRIYESGIMDWDQEWTTYVVEQVHAIVTAYNDAATALSTISPINIDAILQQVNESLEVRRDNITIADGNVTINMSLNVTMKAEDVAIPMIESDLVLKGSSSKVSSLGSSTA